MPPREPRGLVPQGKRGCCWVLAVLTGKPEIRVISPKKKGVPKAERRSGAESPHPGCRYPGRRGLWLKHRLWSAGRAFSFPALKNALFIPSDILFLCFSGVYFFAVLVAVALQPPRSGRAVPRSRWPQFNCRSPRDLLVVSDRSRPCPVGSRRGCPVRTRGAESRHQSPAAPSPSPRLPPKHSEKQEKGSPFGKLFGKYPSSPSREQGSEPPHRHRRTVRPGRDSLQETR